MKLDDQSGLLLPDSVYEEREAKWIQEFIDLLRKEKVEFSMVSEERGIRVTSHRPGRLKQYLCINVFETQAMPPATVFNMVMGWANGKYTPDFIYRLLTPEEQVRLSNRIGEKPSASLQNSQTWLSNELKKREDLRRQGFDPKQEGLL